MNPEQAEKLAEAQQHSRNTEAHATITGPLLVNHLLQITNGDINLVKSLVDGVIDEAFTAARLAIIQRRIDVLRYAEDNHDLSPDSRSVLQDAGLSAQDGIAPLRKVFDSIDQLAENLKNKSQANHVGDSSASRSI